MHPIILGAISKNHHGKKRSVGSLELDPAFGRRGADVEKHSTGVVGDKSIVQTTQPTWLAKIREKTVARPLRRPPIDINGIDRSAFDVLGRDD